MGPTGGRAGSVPADAAGDMATAGCVISETERENECHMRSPELNIYNNSYSHITVDTKYIGNDPDNFIIPIYEVSP